MILPETIFWMKRWSLLTSIGAVIVSMADVTLLQKKTGLLTGGFLAEFYLRDVKAILEFFISSLICDFAVTGIFMMFSFLLLRKWKTNRRVWESLAILISTSPLFLMDLIKYRLEIYIGDIFKLLVLFDLTEKNPLEFLAISYTHITIGLFFFLLAIVAVLIVIRTMKSSGKHKDVPPLVLSAPLLLLPAFVFVFSLCYSTVVRIGSEYLDSSLRRKPSGFIMGVIVNQLSDFDGDGFGLLAKPADPAPFNSKIYPYAVDYPGNGIDENGVGGDLPVKNSVYLETPPVSKKWVFKPHILFFMLESFRYDLVGKNLGGRVVTPVIDSLARTGLSSQSAFSHNGYTSQSRYHTLTGKFLGYGKSLVHDLKENSYFVAFFSAQDVSFGGRQLSFGFDEADISYDARVEPHLRFNTFSTPGSISLSNKVMKKKIMEYLRSYRDDKPLFLYVNFQDTHFPYWNRDIRPTLNDVVLERNNILPENRDKLLSMYQNTAANVDSAIGDILDEAKKVLKGEIAVVITSDHGESLFDDGFLGHGHTLNDHQTRIPLIISGMPAVIVEPFGQADLRGIINNSLNGKRSMSLNPAKTESSEKKIFQYIGNLEKPGQIGFLQNRKRLIYDFRRGVVKEWSGEWKDPKALSESVRADLHELIYLWESMILANHTGLRTLP